MAEQTSYISMQEAASLLGVTSTTLRNWDKAGSLKAVRHPVNNYRMYRMADVIALHNKNNLFPIAQSEVVNAPTVGHMTASQLRRVINGAHRILRNSEGNSSIIERFDELTKLLYCKTIDERRGESVFVVSNEERDKEVASRLRAFLSRLVAETPDLFPKRFSVFRLSDQSLRRLVEHLATVRLDGSGEDLKGLAYEEIIRNTFDKGDHQQFFTPKPLVEFMVEMLDWQNVKTVCDPACGTGGFLLHVNRYLRRNKKPPRLLGFEVDERLAWVSSVNLALHEASDFHVQYLPHSGSLGREVAHLIGTLDAIITNPPFGSDLSDRDALDDFQLGRGRTSRRRGVLFIERCLALLRPGGQLAIIIDDGVLNGPSNEDTRRVILEHARPFAIVSLPDTAFMPYASVKASILFLEKKGRRPTVVNPLGTFFGSAEVVGRRPNGEPLVRMNKSIGRMEPDSDLPEIVQDWRRPNEKGAGVVGSRVRTFFAPIPDIDDAEFAQAAFRLDLAFHHPSRREADEALNASTYPLRSVFELCELRNEMVVPSTELEDEEFIYIGLANIEAYSGIAAPVPADAASLKSAVKRFLPGDILFAKMRPELRKVCLVADDVEGYASAECLVLVPRRGADGSFVMRPELLALLMRSDLAYGQLVHLVIGIGRPRLSQGAVLNVKLPCPPLEQQLQLIELYQRAQAAAQALMVESEQAARKSQVLMDQANHQLVRDLLERR